MSTHTSPLDRLTAAASKHLVGRKIVAVRYMDLSERDTLSWHHSAVVMELDDGNLLWPSMDAEGNDAGALFTTYSGIPTVPPL